MTEDKNSEGLTHKWVMRTASVQTSGSTLKQVLNHSLFAFYIFFIDELPFNKLDYDVKDLFFSRDAISYSFPQLLRISEDALQNSMFDGSVFPHQT